MKKLPLCITLLLLLTCAKEDSQTPNNQPNNITPRYTLTASAGEGGSVAPTTGSFNAGTQVGITATPNAGYSFTGWSTGSTANPLTVKGMGEHIDCDVSKILSREMNMSEAGDKLIETTLRVANGRLTCAEALGHKEFVMTKLYRSA